MPRITLPDGSVREFDRPVTPANVAADIGPVREIISDENYGLLTKPSDATAIAHAVIQLAGDRKRLRDLGEAAASHVAATFDIKRAARQLEELYSRV